MSEHDEFPFALSEDRVETDDDLQSRHVQMAFQALNIAWRNERAAPEILSYQNHIVDTLKSALDDEQERLSDSLSSGSGGPRSFTDQFKQLLLDRLRFIVTAYLRTRLRKIEQFVMKILLTDAYVACLSPAELKFAREYVDLLAQHFDNSFLNQLPERVRSLDDTGDDGNNMIDEPNLDDHVFVRITDNVGPFILQNSQQDQVDLAQNDIVLGRYRAFKVLLQTDQGHLI